MPILTGGQVIDGSGLNSPILNEGAPVNGTDEVQTLTIDATGGTFKLAFNGWTTAAIAWSAVNATLIAAIDAALEALPNIGVGGVATAVGTMTAGVGTATITFSGANVAKTAQPTITVSNNSLTGTATLSVAETTPGVTATARNAAVGGSLVDTTNRKAYINTGTVQGAPTWTVVGTQS